MEINEFWELMDKCDKEKTQNWLEKELSKRNIRDIVHFEIYFREFTSTVSNNYDAWQALRENGTWASDDGWHYCTAWIVSRGKKVYEDIMENPKNIAKYIKDVPFAPGEEGLFYLPEEVVEEKLSLIKQEKLDDHSVRMILLFNENAGFDDFVEFFEKEVSA